MPLEKLRSAIQPLRQSLLAHPIYHDMHGTQSLRIFMEHHVFAVWDFMSLLKALQRQLCCLTLPWIPAETSLASRFINEIVLGEETDEDGRGGHASHFELYHRAMTNFGANTARVDWVLRLIRDGHQVRQALQIADVDHAIQRFVNHTFDVIETGDLCRIAAAFTFGREDLLPDVFQKIVDEIGEQAPGGLDDFRYYLLRHIELDGHDHGPMSARLVTDLCGTDASKWHAAEEAAVSSLTARLDFWDAIHSAVAGLPAEPLCRS